MPKPRHQCPSKICPTSALAPSASMSTQGGTGSQNKIGMEDEEKGSSTVPAVYDINADIEEEYRLFLENARVYENEDFVVEYGGKVIRYGGEAVDDDGCTEVPVKKEKKMVVVISSDESSDDCEMGVTDHSLLECEMPQKKAKIVEDEKKRSILPPDGEEAPIEHAEKKSSGVIWPAHINEREESEFKQRLIGALSKPFCHQEYDKLYRMATNRNRLMKERQMRGRVKYYYPDDGTEKSYFDSYPDLAKEVEETSYPKRLALLRGLFFWLENVGQDHQFRPWRDEHKRYKVIFS
ncbi:uncharacterized protein LOC102711880 [Oryza brachyantha]|uniref:Uncharacterized protein n=1 Tax=Oryza brachyantha TaxID=4533 RepID=J3LW24_ORYBR|nr:uncharacterized protein LOC102711880 [Oryza brachyantha]